MRKLVCLLLALVMSFSLAGTTYGSSASERSPIEISWFSDGYIYTERTPEWNLGIAARENCNAEFVIRYASEPNIVYKAYIPYNNSDGLRGVAFASVDYWEQIKKQGLDLEREAFSTIDIQKSILITEGYGLRGAVSDLEGELEAIYGPEYSNRTIHTSYDYSPHSAKVTEYLEFSAEFINTSQVLAAISLIEFVIGLGWSSKAATVIAALLQLPSIYDLLNPGTSIDRYRCVALFTRYGCINNIALSYATRSDVYWGYETGGDSALESGKETLYLPSQYKYTTYSVLLDEAYDLYLAIYG